MRKPQFVVDSTVVHHQEAAGKPVGNTASGVREGSVCSLDGKYVDVPQQSASQRQALIEQPDQISGSKAQSVPLHSYKRVRSRSFRTKYYGRSCHALATNQANLGFMAPVRADGYDRDDAAEGKVNLSNWAMRNLQALPQLQANGT